MIKELLNKEPNISMNHIKTHKCRFMGDVDTYNITLKDKDFSYVKSILHKGDGGSSVLPIDNRGNILLEIQYRFPIRQPILEMPAGKIDEGENFLECAKRELKEETGSISDNISNQIEYYAQPEFTDEKIGAFLALDCRKVSEQKLDVDESVSVISIPFEIAVELVKKNVIIDERTIITIGIAKCIQDIKFSMPEVNINEYIENIRELIKSEGMKLEEKDIDVDYTEICEFGVIKDHIVKVPGDKNSRRECFYVKSEDIVLPISKNGKIGFLIRYMPSVEQNLIQLPCKLDFDKDTTFEDFGEMVTVVGYANDRQYMKVVRNLEEDEQFIWLTQNDIIEYIKKGTISDGRVLAIVLKFLCNLKAE